jgi:phosphoribosylformylglycinamidine (FGAM) synthase-like enzyme
VTLAEMAFSGKAGLDIKPGSSLPLAAALFNETPGQFVVETLRENVQRVAALFPESAVKVIGHTTGRHARMVIRKGDAIVLNESLAELKALWKGGLAKWY